MRLELLLVAYGAQVWPVVWNLAPIAACLNSNSFLPPILVSETISALNDVYQDCYCVSVRWGSHNRLCNGIRYVGVPHSFKFLCRIHMGVYV